MDNTIIEERLARATELSRILMEKKEHLPCRSAAEDTKIVSPDSSTAAFIEGVLGSAHEMIALLGALAIDAKSAMQEAGNLRGDLDNMRSERDVLRAQLAEQKQALTNQAASLLRGVALAPCWECARLRDQVMEQTRRAEAAIFTLNSPKAALEMCGIFEDHDKERKAQLERAQMRLADCERVIDEVRFFCESFEVNSDRWSTAAWRQKVRAIYKLLPEKRTP